MSRVARMAFALAAAAAAGAAGAQQTFVRETTSIGHPGEGHVLWWRPRTVTFHVNVTSAVTPPCGDAAKAANLAELSIPAWNSATTTGVAPACTDFAFTAGARTTVQGVGSDCVNLVVFRARNCTGAGAAVPPGDGCLATAGACAAKYNCWEHGASTIGLTTTTFDPATGEILDADIEVNGWYPLSVSGAHLSCGDPEDPPCSPGGAGAYDTTHCNAIDIGAVVVHEAGHVLGLNHVCTALLSNSEYGDPQYDDICPAESVMIPNIGDVSLRRPFTTDAAGICGIYPLGGPTSTGVGPVAPTLAETCSSPPKGGCGCGSAGGDAIAGLALALALRGFRRLRRR